MRLRALRIDRLPGIDPGFEVNDVSPGINIVVGPNASGKSSVLRAVRALLYPTELEHAPVDLGATFEDDAGELRVTRVGDIVEWRRGATRVPPPDLPPHHLVGCYTLGIEELAALSGTDDEIAHQLGLELLGGYDLAAVRDDTFRPPGAGRTESERVRRAEDRLRGVLREREQLARQQANLARWRRELDQASAAADDAEAHRSALALLEAGREVAALQERLGGFPDGMERLVGTEGDRLETLRGRREEAEDLLRQARVRGRHARRALSRSGLEGHALTPGDIEEYRSVLQALHRLEGDAETLAADASRAGARLQEAEDALQAGPGEQPRVWHGTAAGAPPLPGTESARGEAVASSAGGAGGARLDPAAIRLAEDSLAAKRGLDAERRALQRELESLPEPDDGPSPEPTADVERLREGRRALTAFLAAARVRSPSGPRVIGLLLVLAGAGGAIAAAARGGGDWRLLAGAGVAVVAGLPLLLRGAGARARHEADARYHATGLSRPTAWDEASVQAQLVQLDDALVRAAARRDALARREAVARSLARLERDTAGAVAALRGVAERVGFDPRHLDADFHRWLRLVEAADRARTDLAEARAELARKRDAIAGHREALCAFLDTHGEAPRTPDADADVLQRRLDALAGRLADRDAAVADMRGADADIARAEADRERQAEEVRELFMAAGLASVAQDVEGTERALTAALHDRLARLRSFRDAREELRDAEARQKERARAVVDRRDMRARVEADDEAGLRRALEALEEMASRSEQLARDITRTETLVAEAERDRALEAAQAERLDARNALSDLVDATLSIEAGRFLLDRVAAEHEERSQPPALRRAAEWFRRFTRNRFELDYDVNREPPFAAVETAGGERRLPAELSTGTRAQLLLAVRVAFALEAEGGRASLPLFLDEALTTADAERFREVADSLAILAAQDGRQLFYLTARGEDAALWRARRSSNRKQGNAPDASGRVPHIIDVARLRHDAEAVSAPELLAADTPPAVPPPDGLSPEAYARALGVPAVDPWRPETACHLFHLLHDTLPLLQRLMQAGVERIGPLRSLLRSPAADTLLSVGERALLTRRVRAVEAFLEGWRHGRGRPVDREALHASGVVSDTFLDRVEQLAHAFDGDARGLLKGLERGDVPRFRTREREALEIWLADNGYLDERAPLDPAALRLRVVSALAAPPENRADGNRPAPGEGSPAIAEAHVAAKPGPAGATGARQDALKEAGQLTSWLLTAVGVAQLEPSAGDGSTAAD